MFFYWFVLNYKVINQEYSMDKETASKVLDVTAKCSTGLAELVPYLKGRCKDSEEYETVAKNIAKVIATIFYEVDSPLYNKHPALKPDSLK